MRSSTSRLGRLLAWLLARLGSVEADPLTSGAVELTGRRLQALQVMVTWAAFTGVAALMILGTRFSSHHQAVAGARYLPAALVTASIVLLLVTSLRRCGLVLMTRVGRVATAALVTQVLALALGVVIAWSAFGGPVDRMLEGRTVSGRDLWIWGLLAALLVTLALMPWCPDGPQLLRRPAAVTRVSPGPPEGTIICCSGGGIRSAAFCLGALQRLQSIGVLAGARAIIGVSGGGYIASAWAVLQRSTAQNHPGRRSFTPESPEVAKLRTKTNYLSSSGPIRYDAAASWALGTAINLILVAAALRLAAFVIGWQALGTGMVVPSSPHLSYHRTWWLNNVWWMLPLVGFAGFALTRIVGAVGGVVTSTANTLIQSFRPTTRVYWSGTRLSLLVGGLAGWTLLNGVPHLAVTLHEAALAGHPNPSIAGVLHHLGFASAHDCDQALKRARPGSGGNVCGIRIAAGADSTTGSASPVVPLVGVTGLLGTLVALIRSAQKDLADLGGTGTWARRLLKRVRRFVAPALTLTLLAILALGVTLVWTCQVLDHSGILAAWSVRSWPAILGNPAVPLAVLAVGTLIDGTATSLFPFYRDRLADAFLMARQSDGEVVKLDRPDWPRLSTLGRTLGTFGTPGAAWSEAMPELVLCTTANIQNRDLLPVGRDGALFVFSGSTIGLSEPRLPGPVTDRLLPAEDYESQSTRQSVANAMAISGGAIAPIAGRDSRIFAPFRVVMALANIRTGAWVRNPCWVNATERVSFGRSPRTWLTWLVLKANDALDRSTVYNVLAEATAVPSIYRPSLYLTDGGQYDNLGLVEAVRRRAARVIVLDASGDPEDGFATIGAAIATIRMDGLAEVTGFDPSPLIRGKRPFARQAWVRATIEYRKEDGSAGGEGELIYIKSVRPKGMTWDVDAYKALHPDFPLTATSDQLYDEFDFEAYRQLGWGVVQQAEAPAGLVAPGLVAPGAH